MNSPIDAELIGKISKKINKSEKYVREQISKKANKLNIQSQAAVIVWAKNLGLNTVRAMRALSPHLQTEVRVGIEDSGRRKIKQPDLRGLDKEQRVISPREILPGFRIKDYDIHSQIKNVTHKRFNSGQYADAVEAAYKLIIRRVKNYAFSKTGKRFEGAKAMGRAFDFDSQTPLVKFNNLISDEEKDEQRGVSFLFKGITFIRNRKAHEDVILNDPNKAIEYISLASLLMRLLDENAA